MPAKQTHSSGRHSQAHAYHGDPTPFFGPGSTRSRVPDTIRPDLQKTTPELLSARVRPESIEYCEPAQRPTAFIPAVVRLHEDATAYHAQMTLHMLKIHPKGFVFALLAPQADMLSPERHTVFTEIVRNLSYSDEVYGTLTPLAEALDRFPPLPRSAIFTACINPTWKPIISCLNRAINERNAERNASNP